MIRLLDCTLRDGGYVNDWRFGETGIPDIAEKLATAKMDILELGFLEDEPYQPDRTIFNDIEQVKPFIGKKRPGILYSVMAEVATPLPLEQIAPADPDGPDLIRVIVWKSRRTADGKEVDMLQEGYAYCKGIVEKGYKLCVQPARVSQYSDKEFVDMLRLFSQLNPLAIYVVDSWGTMYRDDLMHYLNIADGMLKPDIAIGYHGHNNMMQAFDIACACVDKSREMKRDLIIDASVYGIGRGAGNLNVELFAKYMNDRFGCDYDVDLLLEIYDRYVAKIYEQTKWGFSLGFFQTSRYLCNPNYGSYYEQELGLPASQIAALLEGMTPEDRVIYSRAKAEAYLQAYQAR
ncbi:hypothetical protein [Oscillibacter sp.]|uniref:hypothetical protein n=1 Tax=Oscillibacter sp. TaxID=1945593 RepID=UPI0028998909|nr:hypothetical protein [Oscillibacter sp.]